MSNKALSEILATSAREERAVKCPFSAAAKHTGGCVCRGTGKIKGCQKCGGSGWNGRINEPCKDCRAQGAHAAA